MGIFSKGDLPQAIRYEGANDVFVWKHPTEDFVMGSQLIVHGSQEALFFLNGQALDLFPAGRHLLETDRIPLVSSVYSKTIEPKGAFHSEIYFINLTTHMGIKWGTDSKVRFLEPATGIPLDIGACGEFNLRVSDARKLVLKLCGTEQGLDRAALTASGGGSGSAYFRAMIMTRVKSYLAKVIKDNGLDIMEIDASLDTLSAALREQINEGLDAYGLTMPEFYVTTVVTPDEDPNYIRLKQQKAERYLRVEAERIQKSVSEAAEERKVVEAATASRVKIIESSGEAESKRIAAQAEADAYRLRAEAESIEMRLKGYTYAQETARHIGTEAVKGGLVGGSGGGSVLGDVAGFGFSLAAMGGVIDMTKNAMAPAAELGKSIGSMVAPPSAEANPGTAAVPVLDSWRCACGNETVTGKFCAECGGKRPEAPKPWFCSSCGTKNHGKFCGECGEQKPSARKEDM